MREIDDNVRVHGTVVAPLLPTYIFHGADGNHARPANVGVGIWVGTAIPTNAVLSTDFWIDTGGEPLFSASAMLDGGTPTSFS